MLCSGWAGFWLFCRQQGEDGPYIWEISDYIGDYADPTNGQSTGPHVHVSIRESNARDALYVDPGNDSPVRNGIISPGGEWQAISPSHPTPHNGVDWTNPNYHPRVPGS